MTLHTENDRLAGEQLSAVCGLPEAMLSPLDRQLALAPLDDFRKMADDRERESIG